MAMKKSGTSRAGGGPNSRNVKEVPQRLGTPARGISPGAVSQIGSAVGNHATEGAAVLRYRGENYLVGKTPAGGAVPLGNQIATNVGGGGPGAGRTIHHCGSQSELSPTRSPVASGRDILSSYGPDTSNARNRR
jgi:hypothetical protein